MKKLLVFVLTMLLLLCAVAEDRATLSKTVNDVQAVEEIVSALTGEPVEIVIEQPEITEQVTAVVEAFQKVLEDGGVAIECFKPEVQEKIAEKIPEVENLVISEIVPFSIRGYDKSVGDVEMVITFVTEFEPNQKIVIAVGVYADEVSEPEWYVLDAESQENGSVKILFTEECLEAMNTAFTTTLVVLNTAA